jgi:hypothetical protein
MPGKNPLYCDIRHPMAKNTLEGETDAHPEWVTANALSQQTGAERRDVKKWLATEKVETKSDAQGRTLYATDVAVRVIESHRKRTKRSEKSDSADSNIDPKTGLTWFQAKMREDTLQKRRENEIAENLKNDTWMAVEAHHQFFSLLCGKLDQIPQKARSEMGLTDDQMARLRQMIDEARKDAVKEDDRCSSPEKPNSPVLAS